jgi:hypothetical protein
MSDYRTRIEGAVRAAAFRPPTSFSWFGVQAPPLAARIARTAPPAAVREHVVAGLRDRLYQDFYCQGSATPSQRKAEGLLTTGAPAFVAALEAANAGQGYWEDGWQVRTIEDERVAVRRGGLELWGGADEVAVDELGPAAPGARARVRLAKDLGNVSPGFYMALSDEPFAEQPHQPMVRFYWSLSADAAVPFVRRATALLNAARLPFRLKVLNDPGRFDRCDAGVVYVRKQDYAGVVDVLARVYGEVAGQLKTAVPAFAKLLAPGLGLAEDPRQNGQSFGQHRCRLLADGILRAHERGRKRLDERMAVVEERFAEDGIDLNRPYLNPGSQDDYGFRPPRSPAVRRSAAAQAEPTREVGAADCLRVASDIGRRLAREAIWHGDRCNWLGYEPRQEAGAATTDLGSTYRRLGPDLYSGTSGVAWFLAELHDATGDAAARDTALGAMRQALAALEVSPPASRLGLFAGSLGVALAAARVGSLLDEAALLAQARRLVADLVGERPATEEFDLIAGRAGAIPALLILREQFSEPRLLDCATQLGDELIEASERSDGGYSWRSVAAGHWNLTGFSHGTAGVGYALLELFAATEDSRYREAAERAFGYERQWFDADAGNWPDLRDVPRRARRGQGGLPCRTYWCHGAPGIALSRLRAYEHLGDAACEAEALVGLETTRSALVSHLRGGTGNYSLCHGLAGSAEVLLEARRALGEERADPSRLVAAVAHVGIARYWEQGRAWPCGTGTGETPSLMVGLAGIGRFYLRLSHGALPSILLLRPEEFRAAAPANPAHYSSAPALATGPSRLFPQRPKVRVGKGGHGRESHDVRPPRLPEVSSKRSTLAKVAVRLRSYPRPASWRAGRRSRVGPPPGGPS